MEISERETNIIGFLLVLTTIVIQICALMLKTHPDVDIEWVMYTFLILIPGSILLAHVNANRLLSVYDGADYVISLIGLVSIIVLVVFMESIRNWLFPRTIAVYLLMIHSLWVILLGVLIRRFGTV